MTRPIEPGCLVMFVRGGDFPAQRAIVGMVGTAVRATLTWRTRTPAWDVHSPMAQAAMARARNKPPNAHGMVFGVPTRVLLRLDDPDLPAEDTTSLDLSLPTEAPRVKA